MRKTAGNTRTDYRTNTEIAKELNIGQNRGNMEETGCNISTECPVVHYQEY
jgi:hypothetical protein